MKMLGVLGNGALVEVLRPILQAPDRHVLDHALPQRRDTLNCHGGAPVSGAPGQSRRAGNTGDALMAQSANPSERPYRESGLVQSSITEARERGLSLRSPDHAE